MQLVSAARARSGWIFALLKTNQQSTRSHFASQFPIGIVGHSPTQNVKQSLAIIRREWSGSSNCYITAAHRKYWFMSPTMVFPPLTVWNLEEARVGSRGPSCGMSYPCRTFVTSSIVFSKKNIHRHNLFVLRKTLPSLFSLAKKQHSFGQMTFLLR